MWLSGPRAPSQTALHSLGSTCTPWYLSAPVHRWGNRGPEQERDLPKATQPLTGQRFGCMTGSFSLPPPPRASHSRDFSYFFTTAFFFFLTILVYLFIFIFNFFGLTTGLAGSQFPDQGLNPGPRQ